MKTKLFLPFFGVLSLILGLCAACSDSSSKTDGKVPAGDPVIRILEGESFALGSDAQQITIRYAIDNPLSGFEADLTTSAAWLEVLSHADNTFVVAVEENRGAQRKATLRLTYPNTKNQKIEVTQFASGEAPDPEEPDDPDDPDDPNTDPNPTPTPSTGSVYRTGWPELPVEEDENSDYYYAHHLTDLTMKGNQARNYTVCFSAEHHCPVWVAAPRHSAYEGSTNRTDAYQQDPQIPSNLQYSSKSTGGGCNKGHMLGSAERTASNLTNRQVFYYTNIAPQYSSGFNTGGGGWNTLEDWIDGQVCSDTTYLVIGTYFKQYTDGYGVSASPKKIEFGGRSDVSCPTMFYIAVLRTKRGNTGKSVKDCAAGDLKCAAFVRSHSNSHKGQAVTSREMMTIADLEALTGHTFFANVPNAPKSTFSASDWGL